MALKLVFAIAVLALAGAVVSDDDCICDEKQIQEERYAFYNLFAKMKDYGGDDDLPVLPGVLRPLVNCGNCLEYTRKKRTVLPEVQGSPDQAETQKPRIPRRVYSKRCPIGYFRIARMCLPVDLDY